MIVSHTTCPQPAVVHTAGEVYNRTALAFLPCSGNPCQSLNAQSFSKSCELLDGNNAPEEKAKYRAGTWHWGASCAVVAWLVPCRCAACGGTLEEDTAPPEAPASGRQPSALRPH